MEPSSVFELRLSSPFNNKVKVTNAVIYFILYSKYFHYPASISEVLTQGKTATDCHWLILGPNPPTYDCTNPDKEIAKGKVCNQQLTLKQPEVN